MYAKFINILMWVIVVALGVGVVWLIAEPIIWWTEKSEIQIYLRLFLLLFAIQTFATLRLYNAIVVNTRFNIKLRESIQKILTAFPQLERVIKTITTSISTTKSTLEATKKEIVNFNTNLNKSRNELHNSDDSHSQQS